MSDYLSDATTLLSAPQSFDAMIQAGAIDLLSLVAYWKQRYVADHRVIYERVAPYVTAWERIEQEKNLKKGLLSSIAIVETSGILHNSDGRVRKSKKGAAGFFQLMPEIAKRYGLKVSAEVDERSDPIKSAYAAADILTDNYQIFQDWDLAIAGYNSGKVLQFFQEYRKFLISEALNRPKSLKQYIAQEGDSLFLISIKTDTSFYAIKTLNSDRDLVKVGDAIYIPPLINTTLDEFVSWSSSRYKKYPASITEYINYTAKVLALMTIRQVASQQKKPLLTQR
ncbi:MAG: transglycosylase SLT domain-containing protein [Sedimenticola sp.]